MPNQAPIPSIAAELPTILRELASYLRAMAPEGLSQIERQSMEAMDNAAAEIDRLNLAIRSAYVTLEKSPGFAAQMPAFLLHIIRGGTTQEFDAAITKEQNDGQ